MAELSKTKNVHQKILVEYLLKVGSYDNSNSFSIYFCKELLGNTDLLDITNHVIKKAAESYEFRTYLKGDRMLDVTKYSNLSMLILLYLRELDLIDKEKFENIKLMTVNLQFPIVWQLYKENLNYAELNKNEDETPF